MKLRVVRKDKELLKALGRGESQAMEELIGRHGLKVKGVCTRVLRHCPDFIDDACQETWIRVLKGAKKFRGEAAVSSWLYRIAFNECLMILRKLSHVPTLYPLDPQAYPAELPDPDSRLDSRKSLKALSSTVRELPWASPVIHSVAAELDVHEGAAVSNLTVPAFKSRLFRAREILRAA